MREPLVHFLVLGALLFGVFHWRDGGSGSHVIVITPGQIDAIVAGYARTWQRPPTEPELKAQIDEHVRDEIATREALAMGLDRDDTIIRRRLRQKLEFMVEDTLELAPPTDADVQAWLDAHPDDLRVEPRISFRQVYLSPERRGASLESDALSLRERLAAAGPDTDIDALGDPLMVPRDVPRSPLGEVARLFGDGFADELLKVEPGRWSGPLRSGYGLHVVLVRDREDGRRPALEEVRAVIERELTLERRRRRIEAMYEELLARYRVVVEKRLETSTDGAATAPGGLPR